MTKGLFAFHHKIQWIVIGLGIALVVIIALWGGPAAQAQPEQPLAFSHKKHVDAGTQCVYCHPGVLNGPVAGLPSMAKCMGCHSNVQVSDETDQPDVDTLLSLWDRGLALRWVKINDQPDFVYFSHRPHIQHGVSCESCHGNVGQMDFAQPAFQINMGFCLSCHRQQSPDKFTRLVDCKTCHQ